MLKFSGLLRLHCVIPLLSTVFLLGTVLPIPSWLTGNLMNPCELSLGLYNQLHSSGFQFCQTLLLQLSDAPRQLLSSFKTYRLSHTFPFTQTFFITRCLACSPVDQYGPFTRGLQLKNYGERRVVTCTSIM